MAHPRLAAATPVALPLGTACQQHLHEPCMPATAGARDYEGTAFGTRRLVCLVHAHMYWLRCFGTRARRGIFVTGSSLVGAAIRVPRITSKNLIRCSTQHTLVLLQHGAPLPLLLDPVGLFMIPVYVLIVYDPLLPQGPRLLSLLGQEERQEERGGGKREKREGEAAYPTPAR